MQHLDVASEDPRWTALDLAALAERAIRQTLAEFQIDPSAAEVSVLGCDDARIATLNAAFRDKPRATNVLSWPSEERGGAAPGDTPSAPVPGPDGLIELGDIAISYDTCQAEADAAQKPLPDHVIHLLIHASLHLLGFDHETEPDAALMEALEVKILGKLGLDDPYKDI